jgi:hypothetical protein
MSITRTIRDVPENQVALLIASFESEGCKAAATPQTNGLYTVTATCPEAAADEGDDEDTAKSVKAKFAGGSIDPLAIVNIPQGINKGLTSAKYATMLQILGMPRDIVDNKCRAPTNRPLVDLLITKSVGPFSVTGIKPAVASLQRVLLRIEERFPEVYAVLGTAGMTCVRYIKDRTKLSNHSWGCAIDIKIGSVLDGIQGEAAGNDGKTLAGLAAIAPLFNQEGWFWGVGFKSFEDGMHFEIAEETIRAWHGDGTLGTKVSERAVQPKSLSIGDRGADVRRLQEALAAKGHDVLADGEFGPITHAVLIAYQAKKGLVADGVADLETLRSLRLES